MTIKILNRKNLSPCVRNCCLNSVDECLGCGRTLSEIMAWSNLNELQQKQILELASKRKARLNSLP